MIDVFQIAYISSAIIDWKDIKPGDVVVEGNSNRVFRTLGEEEISKDFIDID